ERGGLTLRGSVLGTPSADIPSATGAMPLANGIDAQNPAGVFILRGSALRGLAARMPAFVGGGLNVLGGGVVGYALPGVPGGRLKASVRDVAHVREVLDHCEELGKQIGVAAQKRNDRCAVTVAKPGLPRFTAEVWLDDKTLAVDIGDVSAKASAGHDYAGAHEILGKPWLIGSWGHG